MRTRHLTAALLAALALGAVASSASADEFDVVRQVSVGSEPGPVISAYGAGWVINTGDGTLTRIDATSGTTTTISVGAGAKSLWAAYNSVWVISGSGSSSTIRRLSPSTGAVQKTIKASLPITSRAYLGGAGGYVWASSDDQRKLIRIDPTTNAAAVRSVPSHEGFAVGDGKMWTVVDNSKGVPYLQQWSPSSLAVLRSINVSRIDDGTGTIWLTYGSSHVYLSEVEPNDSGTIGAVSPTAGIVATYDTNIELSCTATGNNALWAAIDYDALSSEAASLVALNEDDLAVLRSQQPFPTGSTQGAAACVGAGSGYIWVPDGKDPGTVYQLVSATS